MKVSQLFRLTEDVRNRIKEIIECVFNISVMDV